MDVRSKKGSCAPFNLRRYGVVGDSALKMFSCLDTLAIDKTEEFRIAESHVLKSVAVLTYKCTQEQMGENECWFMEYFRSTERDGMRASSSPLLKQKDLLFTSVRVPRFSKTVIYKR